MQAVNSATGETKVQRQLYVNNTETDSANPRAKQDTAFMHSMYVGEDVVDQTVGKRGQFGRPTGTSIVGGMDKNLIDYIATGNPVWANYRFADRGTTDYETYKWFSNDLMGNNYEAAEFLKSNPEPQSIISDEDFVVVENNVQLVKALYNGKGDPQAAKAAGRWLTDNVDLTVAHTKRSWLNKINQLPLKRNMIMARIDNSRAKEDYENQFGAQSIDVGRHQSTGFMDGIATGLQTNYMASRRDSRLGKSADVMGAWLSNNPDLDPQLKVEAYRMFAEGQNPQAIFGKITSTEATTKYKQFEIDNDSISGAIGLGVGEYGGNAVNWAVAHPLMKGTLALVAKIPTILRPAATGLMIGGSESIINDVSGGKNFTKEELQHRAMWNAAGGGVLLSTFQLGRASVKSFSGMVKARADTPVMSHVDDEFNKSVDIVRDNIETARVESMQTASELRVKTAMQEQTIIDRAAIHASDEFDPAKTVSKPAPELKAALKEVYDEAGKKGHSKFKTKDAMARELQRMKIRQASELKSKEIAQAKADAKILKDEKAAQDATAKTKEADAKLSKSEDQAKAEQTAKEEFDLASVNKMRVEEGKSPFNNISEDGFEDGMTDLAQQNALKHAETDAATQVAARQSLNMFSRAYDKFTQSIGMSDMTTKGLNMADSTVKYVAAKVLETGAGFAGRASRPASAALIKDTIFKREYSNIMGSYQRSMNQWAQAKGLNYMQNVNARNVGGTNPYANEFHQSVYLTQERLAMGDSTGNIDPFIQSFINDWDKTMGKLFDESKAANVKGFGENKRAHYIPRVWKKGKVKNISDIHGEHNLRRLIKESVESAQRKGKTYNKMDDDTIGDLVDRQLNWINGLGDSMTSHKVGANARTKARAPLDMTVGIELADGTALRMIDLIDTNLPTMASTYTQRASGSIGLARATGGAIRDEADFAKFAENAKTPEAQQYLQDVGDMIFGYPTREGMNPAVRMLMDAAQYAQLETLGVAQLATVGTSLQAVVANWASSPEVAKKIMRMAGQGDGDDVMRSIRERSAVNRDIRFSNRADVHNLDQAQLDDITDFSLAMNAAVDKLTGGDLKPLLSRGLGKLSGYDAIAEYQSRLTQASFTSETARQSVMGKSSFSDQRLVDLGVKNIVDGKIVDGKVSLAYKEHVEFSDKGELVNMHFDDWSDDAIREYTYAMNRYEAQVMPYIMAGELPQFMNMPEMQFALHYLKTPIAFGTKGTARQLGFADKEAAVAVAMNTLSAGLVRYAYVAGSGAAYSAITGDDIDLSPSQNAMQTHNYLDWLGYMGEGYNKGSAIGKAITDGSMEPLMSQAPPAVKQIQNMATANAGALPTLMPGLDKVIGGIVDSVNAADN